MPIDFDYPKNINNVPLRLLAQINLQDLPKNEKLPNIGILQFFILDDDVYGMNLEGEETNIKNIMNNYKVIYHPKVSTDTSKLITDFSKYRNSKKRNEFVSDSEFELSFSEGVENMPITDYRIHSILPNKYLEKYDYSLDHLINSGVENHEEEHKLFGYPFFTQEDPRYSYKNIQNYELLFQMVSQMDDKKWTIIWGDAGVGKFFINPDDLKGLDFSKIFYTWDCY